MADAYATTFSDKVLVNALRELGGDVDKLPGNMGAFWRGLPQPERARLALKANEAFRATVRRNPSGQEDAALGDHGGHPSADE